MIISSKDAAARLNSPNNLFNKIRDGNRREASAMSIFTGNGHKKADSSPTVVQPAIPQALPSPVHSPAPTQESFNPFEKKTASLVVQQVTPTEEPSLDNLLEDSQANIKLALAHNSAVDLLANSISMLSTKLDGVRADKLPSVIAAASKTIESIRHERSEASKNNKGRDVHYHFYTPVQKKMEDYEVIEVEGIVEKGVSTGGL